MIIGLAGRAGSGKSTAASYIASQVLVGRSQRYSFATPLKEYVMAVYGLTQEDVYTQRGKERLVHVGTSDPISVRQILQKEGDHLRAKFGDNYFVNMTPDDRGIVLIIDDVRFENEVKYIHDSGGVVIWIQRDVDIMDHKSESDISALCDYWIGNVGDISDLHTDIEEILHDVICGH